MAKNGFNPDVILLEICLPSPNGYEWLNAPSKRINDDLLRSFGDRNQS